MGLLRVFAAILATAALAGCATPPPPEGPLVVVAPVSVAPLATAPPAAIAPLPAQLAATPQPAATAPYRLAGGDRLRIIVLGQSDLTNTYAVDSVGAISMPLIGRVPAEGRTTAELEMAVAEHFRQGYLRDPSVSIEVAEYRPFFILGAVAGAGRFPFVNGLTVEQAVAAAGGFAPRANPASIAISRVVDGKATAFAAPLAYPVRPGDTITVQTRPL